MYEELIIQIRQLQHWFKPNESECFDPYEILGKAADAIEDLITALTASNEVIAKNKPKWIPVTERLPEVGEFVLVYRDEDVVTRRRLFIDVMFVSNTTDIPYWYCNDRRVLYWMRLPDPPESEESNED